jgi:hypothetical protein
MQRFIFVLFLSYFLNQRIDSIFNPDDALPGGICFSCLFDLFPSIQLFYKKMKPDFRHKKQKYQPCRFLRNKIKIPPQQFSVVRRWAYNPSRWRMCVNKGSHSLSSISSERKENVLLLSLLVFFFVIPKKKKFENLLTIFERSN